MHLHQHGGRGRFSRDSREALAWALAGRAFGHGRGRGFGRDRGDDGDDRFGGRGPGRRRVFDGGELRLVLLRLVADQPRHGYDLIRAIEARSGGAYAPSPGVVYPTLTLLADMGLVAEAPAEGARKPFAVTSEGEAHLADSSGEVEALFRRLDDLAAESRRFDPAPVRRALHNLRSVLHHKMAEGLNGDRVHEVAALLDACAQQIERLAAEPPARG
ncbi:MAG: PadR family transcriptional regulator [Caulobacteraceae bacterium]|nr:PadR family transcriptional regulator [Caulobacter sp.]